MGMLLSQAHCEQMRPHQCAINTLNIMCIVVVAVLNASNIGNNLTRALTGGKQLHSLRRVDVEMSAAHSASSLPAPAKRTSLVHTAASSRRSGTAGAIFPRPFASAHRMLAETAPPHRLGRNIQEGSVRMIIQLAGIKGLLSLKNTRQIYWLKQHDSISRPREFFIRHRCSVQARRLRSDKLRIRKTHTDAPGAKS